MKCFRADPSLPDTPIVHASDVFCELTGLHCNIASFVAKMLFFVELLFSVCRSYPISRIEVTFVTQSLYAAYGQGIAGRKLSVETADSCRGLIQILRLCER